MRMGRKGCWGLPEPSLAVIVRWMGLGRSAKPAPIDGKPAAAVETVKVTAEANVPDVIATVTTPAPGPGAGGAAGGAAPAGPAGGGGRAPGGGGRGAAGGGRGAGGGARPAGGTAC